MTIGQALADQPTGPPAPENLKKEKGRKKEEGRRKKEEGRRIVIGIVIGIVILLLLYRFKPRLGVL